MEIERHLTHAKNLWKLRMIPAHYLVPSLFFHTEYDLNIEHTDRRKRKPWIRDYYLLIDRCACEIWMSKFFKSDNLKTYLGRLRTHYLKNKSYTKAFAKLMFRQQIIPVGGIYSAVDGTEMQPTDALGSISRGDVVAIRSLSETRDKIEAIFGEIEAKPPSVCLTGLTAYKYTSISSLITPSMDLQWLEVAMSFCNVHVVNTYPVGNEDCAKSWVVELTVYPMRITTRAVFKTSKGRPGLTYLFHCDSESLKPTYDFLAKSLSDVYHPVELAGMSDIGVKFLYPVMKNGTQVDMFRRVLHRKAEEDDAISKMLLIGRKGVGKSSIIKGLESRLDVYVDDSDDYGKFLTWIAQDRSVSALDLENILTPKEIEQKAEEFAELDKEQLKSAFNLLVEQEIGRALKLGVKVNVLLNSYDIPRAIYQKLMVGKVLNPMYYERGLLRYMAKNGKKLLIQFSHILSDNTSRMGYSAAFNIHGSFGSTSNIIARSLIRKDACHELVTDLVLHAFYDLHDQPVGYRIEMNQLLDLCLNDQSHMFSTECSASECQEA